MTSKEARAMTQWLDTNYACAKLGHDVDHDVWKYVGACALIRSMGMAIDRERTCESKVRHVLYHRCNNQWESVG